MKKPNFFIVGAPKSGTTALSEYLRAHPRVYMCTPKEPHYFATDIPNYRRVKTEEEYFGLFTAATHEHIAIGEASVFYLYSETAIQNIKKLASNSKIIVLLRNPIDLTYSIHSQLVLSRDENELDFQSAWGLNEARKEGLKIPKYCRDRKVLYYDEIAKLGNQIEKLLNIFPREQVKIIYFQEFIKNTRLIYQEVLDFLGVPDDGRIEFQKINENKKQAIGWLANFTERPPKIIHRYAMEFKKAIGLKQLNILPLLRKLNVTGVQRKPLPIDFRRKLVKHYQDDIVKLSHLTNMNLDYWMDLK